MILKVWCPCQKFRSTFVGLIEFPGRVGNLDQPSLSLGSSRSCPKSNPEPPVMKTDLKIYLLQDDP